MATFPKASRAVTVAWKPLPAVCGLAAVTEKLAAAAGPTLTVALPVISESVAVIVFEPTVFSVVVKTWLPASPAT